MEEGGGKPVGWEMEGRKGGRLNGSSDQVNEDTKHGGGGMEHSAVCVLRARALRVRVCIYAKG